MSIIMQIISIYIYFKKISPNYNKKKQIHFCNQIAKKNKPSFMSISIKSNPSLYKENKHTLLIIKKNKNMFISIGKKDKFSCMFITKKNNFHFYKRKM